MKTLPKSLHTVTALVRVARLIQLTSETAARLDNGVAVYEAMIALGYSPDSDPYGLADAAIAQLNKSAN